MKYVLSLMLLICLTSCKKDFASPEIKESYLSVMKVHDEVMPEVSTIQKLLKKLRKTGIDSEQVKDLKMNLVNADDGMMDWMAAFKLDHQLSITAQLSYLRQEQNSIDKVSEDMKSSIQAAQEFLKNHANDK